MLLCELAAALSRLPMMKSGINLSRTTKVCKFRQMPSDFTAQEPKSGTATFLFKSTDRANLNWRRFSLRRGPPVLLNHFR